jgi:ferredoxin
LLIEIDGSCEDINNGISYLRGLETKVTPIKSAISINFDKCVHCSACVAACEAGAIIRNAEFKIEFDAAKCRECLLCVKACPLRCIRSIF